MLTGTLKTGGATAKVTGRVRGEGIELTAGSKKYRGQMKDGVMELRDGS